MQHLKEMQSKYIYILSYYLAETFTKSTNKKMSLHTKAIVYLLLSLNSLTIMKYLFTKRKGLNLNLNS